MAINFTDSPSNGATQTISGRTYTYNSAKNKWDTTATEVTGPTATVYASVDNLPTSGNITGSQAFVSGTNRLYIWNGSGWYNIALINNTPTISGASSSYALANDGTATTVTLTATDPEGLPITYSIASDTSGNIATVAQGTGSNTNVFTITPSTNSAHAGTFSLTFRASDGVNLATAVSSFTLQFQIQNQRYTTALITSVGANNAVNNSFDDKSTSNHTITANGDVHQTTFSPYRHGGYSTYFDGSGDYLKVTDSAEHDFGTGDFSMEFWWWPESLTGGTGSLHIMISAPNNSHNQLIYHESTYWYFRMGSSTVYQLNSSGTGAATAKQWNHVVLCRSGNTMSIFHNGTRTATDASAGSQSIDFSHASIGRYDNGGYEVDGYVRDMRWLKGSSAYDATQTSITVPTEPLTAVTNTTLLTCHLPYIADGSTTGHSIAVNGNTKTEPFVPYDDFEYVSGSHLGSAHFDANGDYLDIAATTDFGFGTGDFTVEGWYYLDGSSNYPTVWDFRNGNGAYPYIYLRHDLSNTIEYFVNSGNRAAGSISFPIKQWVHYAFVRQSGTTKGYLNGKQDFSTTYAVDFGTSNKLRLGAANGAVNYLLDGNISDFRVVKGTAVYTAEFTPPTAPLTAITNTSLLLQSTDAGIIDKAQGAKEVKLIGNTKSSTTYTKFLSSSIYFDGSGDYINLDDQDLANFGDKPFTVEGWLYLVAYPSQWNFTLDTRSSGSDSNGFCVEVTPSDFGIYAGENMCRSGSAFGLGAWKHWAYTRDASGNHKVFINGTQSGSTFTGSKNYTTNKLKIAAGHNGGDNQNAYMSDIRITKGLARYTSNFTAPTAALTG